MTHSDTTTTHTAATKVRDKQAGWAMEARTTRVVDVSNIHNNHGDADVSLGSITLVGMPHSSKVSGKVSLHALVNRQDEPL
jgi:hypothetical protein